MEINVVFKIPKEEAVIANIEVEYACNSYLLMTS